MIIFNIVFGALFLASGGVFLYMTKEYMWDPFMSIIHLLQNMSNFDILNEEVMYLQTFWQENMQVFIIYGVVIVVMIITAHMNIASVKKQIITKKVIEKGKGSGREGSGKGFGFGKGSGMSKKTRATDGDNKDGSTSTFVNSDNGRVKSGFVGEDTYDVEAKAGKKIPGRKGNGFRVSNKARLNWDWTEKGVFGLSSKEIFREHMVIPNLLHQTYRKRSVVVIDTSDSVYERTRSEHGGRTIHYVDVKRDGVDVKETDVVRGWKIEHKVEFLKGLVESYVSNEEEKDMAYSLIEAVWRVDPNMSVGQVINKIVNNDEDTLTNFVYMVAENEKVMVNWERYTQLVKTYKEKVSIVKTKIMRAGQVFYDYRDTQVKEIPNFQVNDEPKAVYVSIEEDADYVKPLVEVYIRQLFLNMYRFSSEVDVDVFWNGYGNVGLSDFEKYVRDSKDKKVHWFVNAERLTKEVRDEAGSLGVWVIHKSYEQGHILVEDVIGNVGFKGYKISDGVMDKWRDNDVVVYMKGKKDKVFVDNLEEKKVVEVEDGENEEKVEGKKEGKKEEKKKEKKEELFTMDIDTEVIEDPKRDRGVDIEDLLTEEEDK